MLPQATATPTPVMQMCKLVNAVWADLFLFSSKVGLDETMQRRTVKAWAKTAKPAGNDFDFAKWVSKFDFDK